MKSKPKPERIRLRRSKGWRLQDVSMALNGLPAVNVARPSRWGNRYRIGEVYDGVMISNAQMAVEYFQSLIDKGFMRLAIRRELAGKNLACFCKPDEWCHADVLLEIANKP